MRRSSSWPRTPSMPATCAARWATAPTSTAPRCSSSPLGVNQSPLAFWVSDSDEAIADAESAASAWQQSLSEAGARTRATTGESEPLLALQDALATYQADQVLVFVREEDEALPRGRRRRGGRAALRRPRDRGQAGADVVAGLARQQDPGDLPLQDDAGSTGSTSRRARVVQRLGRRAEGRQLLEVLDRREHDRQLTAPWASSAARREPAEVDALRAVDPRLLAGWQLREEEVGVEADRTWAGVIQREKRTRRRDRRA